MRREGIVAELTAGFNPRFMTKPPRFHANEDHARCGVWTTTYATNLPMPETRSLTASSRTNVSFVVTTSLFGKSSNTGIGVAVGGGGPGGVGEGVAVGDLSGVGASVGVSLGGIAVSVGVTVGVPDGVGEEVPVGNRVGVGVGVGPCRMQ